MGLPAVLGALGAVGGNIATSGLSNRAAKKERQNAQAWEAQRYQVAAKDMEAAGLNRILALGSPASNVGQADVGFSNAGDAAVAGATAAQNITESETRKTLNKAAEQAAISSAVAADEKAKLDAETARKIREMLPGEKSIQSKTERGMDRDYQIKGVEEQLKKLDLSKEEFYKKIYAKIGPIADSLLDRISPMLSSALQGSRDGIGGLIDALTESGYYKPDKHKSFIEWLFSPSDWGDWNTDSSKSENRPWHMRN